MVSTKYASLLNLSVYIRRHVKHDRAGWLWRHNATACQTRWCHHMGSQAFIKVKVAWYDITMLGIPASACRPRRSVPYTNKFKLIAIGYYTYRTNIRDIVLKLNQVVNNIFNHSSIKISISNLFYSIQDTWQYNGTIVMLSTLQGGKFTCNQTGPIHLTFPLICSIFKYDSETGTCGKLTNHNLKRISRIVTFIWLEFGSCSSKLSSVLYDFVRAATVCVKSAWFMTS